MYICVCVWLSSAKLKQLIAAQKELISAERQPVSAGAAAGGGGAEADAEADAAAADRQPLAPQDMHAQQQVACGVEQHPPPHPPSSDDRVQQTQEDMKRIRVEAGTNKFVLRISACCSVKQACAVAEERMGVRTLGARRIVTFALPDGCELDADDRIVDAVSEMVKEPDMLRAVFASLSREAAGDRAREEAAEGESG